MHLHAFVLVEVLEANSGMPYLDTSAFHESFDVARKHAFGPSARNETEDGGLNLIYKNSHIGSIADEPTPIRTGACGTSHRGSSY